MAPIGDRIRAVCGYRAVPGVLFWLPVRFHTLSARASLLVPGAVLPDPVPLPAAA